MKILIVMPMAQGTKKSTRAIMMLAYGTALLRLWLNPRLRMESSKGIRPRAAMLEQVVITMLGGYQRERRHY